MAGRGGLTGSDGVRIVALNNTGVLTGVLSVGRRDSAPLPRQSVEEPLLILVGAVDKPTFETRESRGWIRILVQRVRSLDETRTVGVTFVGWYPEYKFRASAAGTLLEHDGFTYARLPVVDEELLRVSRFSSSKDLLDHLSNFQVRLVRERLARLRHTASSTLSVPLSACRSLARLGPSAGDDPELLRRYLAGLRGAWPGLRNRCASLFLEAREALDDAMELGVTAHAVPTMDAKWSDRTLAAVDRLSRWSSEDDLEWLRVDSERLGRDLTELIAALKATKNAGSRNEAAASKETRHGE